MFPERIIENLCFIYGCLSVEVKCGKKTKKEKQNSYYYQIALSLWNSSKTLPEIKKDLDQFLRRFGLFLPLFGKKMFLDENIQQWLQKSLDELVLMGWAQQENQYYSLI